MGYYAHLYCKIFFQHFLLCSQKSKHKQWKLDAFKNLLTDKNYMHIFTPPLYTSNFYNTYLF